MLSVTGTSYWRVFSRRKPRGGCLLHHAFSCGIKLVFFFEFPRPSKTCYLFSPSATQSSCIFFLLLSCEYSFQACLAVDVADVKIVEVGKVAGRIPHRIATAAPLASSPPWRVHLNIKTNSCVLYIFLLYQTLMVLCSFYLWDLVLSSVFSLIGLKCGDD